MRTGLRLHREQELVKNEILTVCIGVSIGGRINKNDMFTPTSSGKMPREGYNSKAPGSRIRSPTEEHEVRDNTQLRIVGMKEH